MVKSVAGFWRVGSNLVDLKNSFHFNPVRVIRNYMAGRRKVVDEILDPIGLAAKLRGVGDTPIFWEGCYTRPDSYTTSSELLNWYTQEVDKDFRNPIVSSSIRHQVFSDGREQMHYIDIRQIARGSMRLDDILRGPQVIGVPVPLKDHTLSYRA